MIDLSSPYYSEHERELSKQFLEQGYVIFPIEQPRLQDEMKSRLLKLCSEYLDASNLKTIGLHDLSLENIHECVSPEQLNALRLNLIQNLSSDALFKQQYFQLGQPVLHALVGNELAMQRVCNLSIQMPQDSLSLLPLHADTWSGNSPYEVVFWLPFTDCKQTNSMHILPLKQSWEVYQKFSDYAHLDSEGLYQALKDEFIWLEIPYGHGLIFSHSLLHGNRVNEEQHSRWSFNMRFKGLLTPYGDKALGETFQPITMKPLTQLGFQYQHPIMEAR